MTNKSTDSRKISDVILSLEDKVITLIKTVAASDMNNKIIIDRLNKLVSDKINLSSPVQISKQEQSTIEKPTKATSQLDPPKVVVENENSIRSNKLTNNYKIPVGQRITDQNGKDLFMAEVIISDKITNEVLTKTKTSAVGKWQAYLPVGKYSIYISKIIDANTLNKIESFQDIEINENMKSLQLPIAIIKR